MPHTFRSYSDLGIADTLWKRARRARQARSSDGFIKSIKKTPSPVSASIAAAIANFLKRDEDAKC